MTPRGRAALVLGLVMLFFATLAATSTVYAGQHSCGSALSAHTPDGNFTRARAQSLAEDRCDQKVTGRRELVAVVGILGLVIAVAGAFDHKRASPRSLTTRRRER